MRDIGIDGGNNVQAGRVSRFLGASVLMATLFAHGAFAQDDSRPPGDVPGMGDPQSEEGALALRINRLEAALRRATGDIEELQNENHKLADQFKRFREDVEFRLSGKSGASGAPLADAEPSAGAPARPQRHSDSIAPVEDAGAPAPTRPQRHSDVFDPDANPAAPGAPRQMGTTAPSAPLNLASRPPPDETAGLKPLPAPERQKLADDAEPSFVAGGVPFSDSKEQFKAAVVAYRAGQYADAEAQFKAYLTSNPATANAADAVFYIGETYLQRSRLREAAEQYLKVSTEYAKSPRAPESMMRLGETLARLGNKEQACATFAEVGKRYPRAPSDVKRSIDREIQTNRCS
jgi:tol-pal system protein YbgF